MKTLSEILRDADPVRHEPPWTVTQRQQVRRAVVSVPRAAAERPKGRMMFATAGAGVVLVMITIVGWSIWPHTALDLVAAIRFEARLAEERPGPGLREVLVRNDNRRIYIRQDIIVTNDDIAGTRVVRDGTTAKLSISIEFTPEGAAKMLRATQGHVGKPLAILLDGEVAFAPTVRGAIHRSAIIDGDYSKAEAERIAEGIRGR